MRIIMATIDRAPESLAEQLRMGQLQDRVHVTYEDRSTEHLFSFFSDEIDFTEVELVGLTRDEAQALRLRRDTEYLRS